MDEQNESNVDDTMKSLPKGNGKKTVDKAREKYEKSKTRLNRLKKFKSFAPLITIISSLAIILIIIFVTIGFVGFFLTMPGLITDKVVNTCKDFWNWFIDYDNEIKVNEEELNNLAKYLEEMGYDIVGYGFVQSTRYNDEDGKITIKENDDKTKTKIRYSNLYAYILANERTYTIKGRTTDRLFDSITWGGVRKSISNLIKIFNYGNSNNANAHYGMLQFEESWITDNQQSWDGFNVSIDRNSNQLVIDSGRELFGGVNRMTWDLSGWTSRYGKPVELSLALHLSTMAPDFVYNFCMDNDLQTNIILSTQRATYSNIEYTYVKDGAKKAAIKSEVETWYKKIEANQDSILRKSNLFSSDSITIRKYNDQSYIAPLDTLFDTSIVRIKKGDNTDYSYYRAVDKDGNEISFKNNTNYTVEFNDGQPYFQENANGNIKIPEFIFSSADANDMDGVKLDDETYILLEILSLNDLISLDDAGVFVDSKQVDSECKFLDRISNNVVSQLDNFIDVDIVKKVKNIKKDHDITVDFSLQSRSYKSEKEEKEKYDSWNFSTNDDEKTKYDQHNAEAILNNIRKEVKEENRAGILKDRINAYDFQNWMKQVTEQIRNVSSSIDKIYLSNMEDNEELEQFNTYLSDILMDYAEFIDLYNLFKSFKNEFNTYQPYIKSVTHHWFKDIYFEDDDGFSVYDKDNHSSFKEEFVPEFSNAKDKEKIEKFMKNGTFIYNGSTENGVKQNENGNAREVQGEPWHYKVKNWLEYGYYFIYDGTTQTAKNIEAAKKLLKDDYSHLYNEENPLLLSEYATAKKDDTTQQNLFEKGVDKNKIDKRAEEINNILKQNGHKVRLEKIDFQKSASLTAFSILEGLHTEDSELIYEDLKRFMVEMKYFEYSDFETIETDVFKWLIPDYTVYKNEWPDPKYEKIDTEYGTYIRSKSSVDKQREKENEEARKKEEAEETEKKDNETNQMTDILKSNNGVVYSQNTDSSLHCDSTTTINGVTYRNYKQGYSEWASNKFSGGNMASSACGATSAAVILSGYGKTETPVDTAKYLTENYGYPMDTAATSIVDTLNHFGVPSTYSNGSIEEIRKAWAEGKPVIYNTGPGQMTSEGHYCVILGEVDEKVIISQVGGNGYAYIKDNYIYNGNLEELVRNNPMRGIIIPNEAPSGVNYATTGLPEIVGYEPGLDVVMPENGKIIEIGKVENNKDKDSDDKNSSEEKDSDDTKQTEIEVTGDYIIIEFDDTGHGVDGWKMRIEGFALDTITAEEGVQLDQGEVIGITTESNMKVILYDKKDAIIDNIQDYFVLEERKSSSGNTYANGNIAQQIKALQSEGFNVGTNANEGHQSYAGAIKWKSYVDSIAPRYDLDTNLVIAMIAQESAGSPDVNGAAVGLMCYEKTNSSTIIIKDANGNDKEETDIINRMASGDIELMINVGCAAFKQRLDEYNGNVLAALQGYNYGPGGIRRCISYHIADHKNEGNKYCGIDDTEYNNYISSGDIGWLEDREWYTNIGWTAFGQGGGDAKYVEHILQYYKL